MCVYICNLCLYIYDTYIFYVYIQTFYKEIYLPNIPVYQYGIINFYLIMFLVFLLFKEDNYFATC